MEKKEIRVLRGLAKDVLEVERFVIANEEFDICPDGVEKMYRDE